MLRVHDALGWQRDAVDQAQCRVRRCRPTTGRPRRRRARNGRSTADVVIVGSGVAGAITGVLARAKRRAGPDPRSGPARRSRKGDDAVPQLANQGSELAVSRRIRWCRSRTKTTSAPTTSRPARSRSRVGGARRRRHDLALGRAHAALSAQRFRAEVEIRRRCRLAVSYPISSRGTARPSASSASPARPTRTGTRRDPAVSDAADPADLSRHRDRCRMQQGRSHDGAVSARAQLGRARWPAACCGNASCVPICPIGAKYDASVHVRRPKPRARASSRSRSRTRSSSATDRKSQRDSLQASRRQRARGARQDFRDRRARDRDAEAPADVEDAGQRRTVANSSDQVGRNLLTQLDAGMIGTDEGQALSRIAAPWRRPASASFATAISAVCMALPGTSPANEGWYRAIGPFQAAERFAAQGLRGAALGAAISDHIARELAIGPVGRIPARSGQSRHARDRQLDPLGIATPAHRVQLRPLRDRRHEGRHGLRTRRHECSRRHRAPIVRDRRPIVP